MCALVPTVVEFGNGPLNILHHPCWLVEVTENLTLCQPRCLVITVWRRSTNHERILQIDTFGSFRQGRGSQSLGDKRLCGHLGFSDCLQVLYCLLRSCSQSAHRPPKRRFGPERHFETPPPSPFLWVIRQFLGGREGVYILTPPRQEFYTSHSFLHPPTLEGYCQGWGDGGYIKFGSPLGVGQWHKELALCCPYTCRMHVLLHATLCGLLKSQGQNGCSQQERRTAK